MINIDSMVIEVTRRCNMTCAHCLRGEPQKKDISDSILDTFFSKVGKGYISNLTITGGEPSLVPDRINAIVDAAERHGTSIGAFYIVTNGKQVSDAFLLAVMRLYCICGDKESCGLQYSNDVYHNSITAQNRDKLEVFRFTSPRNTKEYTPRQGEYEINEGRAKRNNIGVREEKGINPEYFELDNYIDTEDESIRSEMTVYLNCKGNIVCGCDWSYRSQDRKSNVVCHVDNFSITEVYAYLMEFEVKAQKQAA